MRKTFVYDENLGKMVPGTAPRRGSYSPIFGDLPDFQSPVDGSIVNGRKGLRDQFARHGVTHASDFTQTWKKSAEQRAAAHTPGSGYERNQRKQALIESYKKLTRS